MNLTTTFAVVVRMSEVLLQIALTRTMRPQDRPTPPPLTLYTPQLTSSSDVQNFHPVLDDVRDVPSLLLSHPWEGINTVLLSNNTKTETVA